MSNFTLNIPWFTPPKNDYYGGQCGCASCRACLSKTLDEAVTLDIKWYMHPPYENYRCCVCGIKAYGSLLKSTWALLCPNNNEADEAVQYFRHALLPAMNYWDHIYEGLHGSNSERKYGEEHFHRMMQDHLRRSSCYFQLCPGCRMGTRTVREFLDKYNDYERGRLETLDIIGAWHGS